MRLQRWREAPGLAPGSVRVNDSALVMLAAVWQIQDRPAIFYIASLLIGGGALGAAVLWLLFVQVLAVLAWDADLLTRQAALLHWLAVGVLPPALALWSLDPRRR